MRQVGGRAPFPDESKAVNGLPWRQGLEGQVGRNHGTGLLKRQYRRLCFSRCTGGNEMVGQDTFSHMMMPTQPGPNIYSSMPSWSLPSSGAVSARERIPAIRSNSGSEMSAGALLRKVAQSEIDPGLRSASINRSKTYRSSTFSIEVVPQTLRLEGWKPG